MVLLQVAADVHDVGVGQGQLQGHQQRVVGVVQVQQRQDQGLEPAQLHQALDATDVCVGPAIQQQVPASTAQHSSKTGCVSAQPSTLTILGVLRHVPSW